MLKPYMIFPITNAQTAVEFICQLWLDGKLWHFDDDPKDFVSNDTDLPAFTDKQVEHLRERRLELFEHLEDPHKLALCLVEESNQL